MKWILWTVAGLVAIVGIAALVGWLLPVKHEASRTAHIDRPREDVYAAIADVAAYPTWFSGVSRVEMLDAPAGTIRFRQHSATGPLVMEVVEATPPSRFVTRIPSSLSAARGRSSSYRTAPARAPRSPSAARSTIRSSASWRASSSDPRRRWRRA